MRRRVFALAFVALLILAFGSLQPGDPTAAVQAAPPPAASDVERRIDGIVKRMTLDEKLDYIGGVNNFYVRAHPRLHLPALRMADGPLGVRNVGPSTAYAAGIALAASFDTDLAGRVGALIGRDARARGVHVLLGPGMNIYRSPLCGRNFEYFGEDPFLASRMAVAYIRGVQAQGVSATAKHFIANNSEFDRHHADAVIDERTMREIYLPAFEAAVTEAHVGAIMSAYGLVNGVHMTQHDRLNNQLVKKEWAFDGLIMSDWMATYDGVAAANAGLDLEMPSGAFMNRATLLPAIQQGKVTVATIDDKVRRILRKAIQFGWLDREQTDLAWPLFAPQGRQLALETARGSMVLLKNQGDLLPLDKSKLKSIAVIGPDAYPAIPAGGGSAQVRPFVAVSFLEGLAAELGAGASVTFNRGVATLAEIFDSSEFVTSPQMGDGPGAGKPGLIGEYFNDATINGHAALTRVDEHVNFAWDKPVTWPTGPVKTSSARWTGFFIPPSDGDYRFAAFTYGLDEYRLYLDGKLIFERSAQTQPIASRTLRLEGGRAYAVRFDYVHADHHARVGFGVRRADQLLDPAAKALAARADVAIVLAGFDPMTEAEGYDRTFQLPLGQDELINSVRAANKNTVVALTAGGGVDMLKWIDRVPAVIQTWYAGQEAGTALAQLLVGAFSPSGKLPASFERRLEDGATFRSYYPQAPRPSMKVAYSEGVFVGYRHFDHSGIKPLFPFGHGLSFTRFKLADLRISPEALDGDAPVTVSFAITNIGARAGAEVVQVYVADHHAPVPRPPKELKGFAKISLEPGESRRAQVQLDRRAFSYFDVGAQRWTAAPGDFEILVGTSSQSIELRGKVTLRN
ncbi:MAG TPA: glycoside hydrolase family 3 C-terminal domain-containing protein [Polyangia bacterium]|jgi:beta-glucosidase|nr:glycoside hydrolase family 3 C-terminal domain-containing protein [Polyangia bacterium]